MSTKEIGNWLASLLSAALLLLVLEILSAPPWAAVGLSYLGFLIWRLGDHTYRGN